MRKLTDPYGQLTMQLGGLEKILKQNGNNGHVAGNALSVADIAIWSMISYISGGFIVGIPRKYISDNFAAIDYLWAKMDTNLKIQEWKLKHPTNYEPIL